MGTDNSGALRPDLEGIAARAEAARAVGTPYPVPHQILATAADLPAVTAYALHLEADNQRLRDAERRIRQVAHNMLADMYDESRRANVLGSVRFSQVHSRWARFFTDSSITNPASEAGHVG